MQRTVFSGKRWTVAALMVLGVVACAAPLVNFYSVDRHVPYDPSKNFDAFVLRQLEQLNKGVEIAVAAEDIPRIRRGLRRWMDAIRETRGVVYDPKGLIEEYRLLEHPGKDDKIKQIVEFIANKTADLFGPVNENRRRFYARRVNLALRQKQNQLLIYFVRRP